MATLDKAFLTCTLGNALTSVRGAAERKFQTLPFGARDLPNIFASQLERIEKGIREKIRTLSSEDLESGQIESLCEAVNRLVGEAITDLEGNISSQRTARHCKRDRSKPYDQAIGLLKKAHRAAKTAVSECMNPEVLAATDAVNSEAATAELLA